MSGPEGSKPLKARRISSAPGQKSPVRTFRQRGAVVTGWFLLVVFAVVLTAITFSEGWDPSATFFVLAVMGAVYLLLVRPAVRISAAGVRLDNVLREVDITWPAVDMLEDRWNLKVVTPDGKAFASWAISAQRPKMSGGVTQTAAGSMVPTATSDVPMGQTHRGGSAGAVAAAVEEAKVDYERALAAGRIEPQEATAVRRVAPVAAAGWVLVAVAALLGAVLL